MRDFDLRRPASGEVLVATRFTCVRPGTELRCLAGRQPDAVGFPYIPGYAMVGEVIAVGPEVSMPIGTHVYLNGTRDGGSLGLMWGTESVEGDGWFCRHCLTYSQRGRSANVVRFGDQTGRPGTSRSRTTCRRAVRRTDRPEARQVPCRLDPQTRARRRMLGMGVSGCMGGRGII